MKVEEVTYASSKNVIPGFSYNNVGYLSKASDPDYITSLDKHGSSADFHIWQAPAERHAWCAKVVVRTGINPTPGMGYRISFNLDADSEQNLFELFCDGNEELAYGALYEKHLDMRSIWTLAATSSPSPPRPARARVRFSCSSASARRTAPAATTTTSATSRSKRSPSSRAALRSRKPSRTTRRMATLRI